MSQQPYIFRVIVIEEVHQFTNPRTFKEESIKVYYAQALEWDLGASGETAEEAIRNIEKLLAVQKYIYDNDPMCYRLGPAPEEWQRLRNIGKEMIQIRKDYREAFGDERYPIVCRKDIDIRTLEPPYEDLQ